MPKLRWLELVTIVAACSSPPAPKAVEVRDPMAGTWKITAHVLANNTEITEDDAMGFHDRTVELGEGYTSPWHGSCEEASRQRRDHRILADVTAELNVAAHGRAAARAAGLGDELVEHRLTCRLTVVPPITVFITGERGMTCFAGACYFLRRN